MKELPQCVGGQLMHSHIGISHIVAVSGGASFALIYKLFKKKKIHYILYVKLPI